MKETKQKYLWSYVGRFILIHIVIYTVIAIIFQIIQGALHPSARIALDFFEPYRPFSVTTIPIQAVRGGVLALIFYPFYNTIVRGNRGWLILFGALWGLTLLGSVEPIPGSIEGMIYTQTSIIEHMLVLIAGAIHVLVFCWMFLRWETRSLKKRNTFEMGGVNLE